jgi:sodium-dependent dicarboxylate transporter 2/3/5
VLLWMTEALHGMGSNVVAFFPVAALPLLGILDKKDIRNLPWEVLWLVAGGISLGVSLQNTGLASWLVESIDWASLGGLGLLVLFSLVTFVMANFLSHTVTATLITPLALGVGAGLAAGSTFDPVLAGLVIAVASSLGMSLPISTPPNAIAMSTGLVQTKDMALVGLILGIGGLLLGLIFAKFYWPMFCLS